MKQVAVSIAYNTPKSITQTERFEWRLTPRAAIWFPVMLVYSLVALTPISKLCFFVTGRWTYEFKARRSL